MNRNAVFILIVSFFLIINALFIRLPKMYNKSGLKDFDRQNYVEAAQKFRMAYYLKQNNSEYKYNYILALSKLKPNYYVQKEVFGFANDGAKDSAHQLALLTINKWQNKIFKTIGDNYIEQVPYQDKIVRWDVNKFPLKVFTVNESGKELPPYYIKEINNALAQWQNSSSFIKFKVTNDVNQADITIRIKLLPDNVCENNNCIYTVGFTEPEAKGNVLKKMKIVLYSNDPLGNWFSDKEIYNTTLHELGHALGIMGHSYNPNDLMYIANKENPNYVQYKSDFQYLSAKDVNTINLLYKLAPDVTNSEKVDTNNLIYPPIVLGTSQDMLMRKLNEAVNYIKRAPKISSGYVDLGIIYSEMGNYKDAVKSFERAYKLSKSNSEKYIATYNIAMVYFENKKFDKAEKYAKLAQSISDTEDIRKLLAEINLHK